MNYKWQSSIPRFGIPRLQPGEECGVIRGRSRYYREPPAPARGDSTFDDYLHRQRICKELLKTPRDKLVVTDQSREAWNPPAPAGGGMRSPIRSRAGCTRGRSRYYREPPAPVGGGSTATFHSEITGMNPNASFGVLYIVPLSFARGIIRLTLQTSSRLVGFVFSESH